MKKKSVIKRFATLMTVLGISLSSSIVSYANVNVIIDCSIEPTDTREIREFKYEFMGINFRNITTYHISDVNATFKINKTQTTNVALLGDITYGYIENDKLIETYINYGVYITKNNMDGVYPLFHKEQVQRDQQAGITDRVYVMMIDGIAEDVGTDNFFPFLFKLSANATPAQTEGWVQDSIGWWWRNADGSYPVNTSKEINGKQYYFGADGYMLTKESTPEQTEGWVQDSVGWWWRNADGSYPVNAWREIKSKWYYFGADGYMLADEMTPDGYWVDSDGVMRTEEEINQGVLNQIRKEVRTASIAENEIEDIVTTLCDFLNAEEIEEFIDELMSLV